MRTTGSFAKIYKQAREYYTNAEKQKTSPMDAVVRRENGKWMIESGLEPSQNADVECTLESFDSYFYETYSDAEYEPSESDEKEFADVFKVVAEEE